MKFDPNNLTPVGQSELVVLFKDEKTEKYHIAWGGIFFTKTYDSPEQALWDVQLFNERSMTRNSYLIALGDTVKKLLLENNPGQVLITSGQMGYLLRMVELEQRKLGEGDLEYFDQSREPGLESFKPFLGNLFGNNDGGSDYIDDLLNSDDDDGF